MHEWTHGEMDGCIWMEGWMEGWMEEWMCQHPVFLCLFPVRTSCMWLVTYALTDV